MSEQLAERRSLATHLVQKREAMRAEALARPTAASWDEVIEARCVADDITGARKWRIREWNYVGDGGPGIGGYELGPSSPELLCGVISTCLTHTILCLAAMRGLSLDRVDVHVSAKNNDAGFFHVESDRPTTPHDIMVTVDLEAPTLTESERDAFVTEAQNTCPVLIALRNPTEITVVRAPTSR